MRCVWDPDPQIIQQLFELINNGSSIRSAASKMNLPYSVAYQLCKKHNIQSRFSHKRHTTPQQAETITTLWTKGLAPMDIARQVGVSPTVVYQIGIQQGMWQRMPQQSHVRATTRRCEYLILRINALSRHDAAKAVGIHPKTALDYDKGLMKFHGKRVPFVPGGPDAAWYKRCMQLMPYVDQQVATGSAAGFGDSPRQPE